MQEPLSYFIAAVIVLTISHIQWFPAVGGESYLCAVIYNGFLQLVGGPTYVLTISHIQWFPAVGGGSYLCAEALGRCDAAQLGALQCSFGLWYCPLWAVQDHHHPTAQPIPCQVSNCTVCAVCMFNVSCPWFSCFRCEWTAITDKPPKKASNLAVLTDTSCSSVCYCAIL